MPLPRERAAQAPLLREVSAERAYAELTRLLCGGSLHIEQFARRNQLVAHLRARLALGGNGL